MPPSPQSGRSHRVLEEGPGPGPGRPVPGQVNEIHREVQAGPPEDRLEEGRHPPGERSQQQQQGEGVAAHHHSPWLGMEAQGSCGRSASPDCRSSMLMPSGERTKAMWPSRGGRLMVTPESTRCWHSA